MNLGIEGKHALVLGGSSGMGLATAHTLAAEGVNITIFARGRESLDKAAAELREKHQVKVNVCAGDMTKKQDVRALSSYLDTLGGIDILILNSPRPPTPFRNMLEEVEDQRWHEAYETQLHSALLILRELAPSIAAKGWGRIVAITSASVKQPMPKHALSTVFRAGVTAALKHLANELADRGVTVNAVCPASVLTDGFAKHFDAEKRRQLVPMKRLGKTSELAGTVAFLASEQAGYITGASLQVDGGLVASLY